MVTQWNLRMDVSISLCTKFTKGKLQYTQFLNKKTPLVLPLFGISSNNIKKKLDETYRKILPFCELKIVSKTSSKMSSYLSSKDKIAKSLISGVIYKSKCINSNVSYVDCTDRYLEKGLEDRAHISALTWKLLSGCQVFAPIQHVKTANYNSSGPKVSHDDIEILVAGKRKCPYQNR